MITPHSGYLNNHIKKKSETVCTSETNQPADSCGRHLPLSGSVTQLTKKPSDKGISNEYIYLKIKDDLQQ